MSKMFFIMLYVVYICTEQQDKNQELEGQQNTSKITWGPQMNYFHRNEDNKSSYSFRIKATINSCKKKSALIFACSCLIFSAKTYTYRTKKPPRLCCCYCRTRYVRRRMCLGFPKFAM